MSQSPAGRALADLEVVSKISYSLLEIEEHFLDLAPIPETKKSWEMLRDELKQAAADIENWLSQKSEVLK